MANALTMAIVATIRTLIESGYRLGINRAPQLGLDGETGGRVERAIVFHVHAWDINCPQPFGSVDLSHLAHASTRLSKALFSK